MNFQETVAYLYEMLPMYQRSGKIAFKKDLANTHALCRHLGDPQTRFRSVHIAGTNGKGSSAHMIASVLQEAGLVTGLYTSPHIWRFTERIRINGAEISEDYVVEFVRQMRTMIEKIEPSFFELTVAMAFKYFADMRVDMAVVEVGLGGRLDSTNIIVPEVCLITNISYDHMDMLGDTLPLIAGEKAGIIKPGIPCVIGQRQDEVTEVFISKSQEAGSPVYFASDEIECSMISGDYLSSQVRIRRVGKDMDTVVRTDLTGHYQGRNIPGVIKSLELLPGTFAPIPDEFVYRGLSRVRRNTGLRGRFDVLARNPMVLCDAAHNEGGIRAVTDQLQHIPHRQLIIIWAMVNDKNTKKLLGLLPKRAFYYFCQARIPRAMPARDLWSIATDIGLEGVVLENVNEAIAAARAAAHRDDLIFVGGSNFIIAEIALAGFE